MNMHDWTLLTVLFDWKADQVTLEVRGREIGIASVVATGVADLHITQTKEWGPSVSINKATGPTLLPNGRYKLDIEMQTGDIIGIEAASFDIPPATGSIS